MPSRNLDDIAVEAIRSDDLLDLLEHIAWTDTLRPALLTARDQYTKQLVAATLGVPVEITTRGGHAIAITREQLAGRISGIDFILDLITKILSRGSTARDSLRDLNLNL